MNEGTWAPACSGAASLQTPPEAEQQPELAGGSQGHGEGASAASELWAGLRRDPEELSEARHQGILRNAPKEGTGEEWGSSQGNQSESGHRFTAMELETDST